MEINWGALINGGIGLILLIFGSRLKDYVTVGSRADKFALVAGIASRVLTYVRLQRGLTASQEAIIQEAIAAVVRELIGLGFNPETVRAIAEREVRFQVEEGPRPATPPPLPTLG